ncbi:hypothetical protein D3C72_1860220 [compost metagenome]
MRGAILRSSATLLGPVMSRRRSVFSMPTSRNGRMLPLPVSTCTNPATCRKSSPMPPSGMYSTGSGVFGSRPHGCGRYTLMRRVSPSALDCTVKVSPMVSGEATTGCDAGSAAISGVAETADNNSDSTIKRIRAPHPGKDAEHSVRRQALAAATCLTSLLTSLPDA